LTFKSQSDINKLRETYLEDFLLSGFLFRMNIFRLLEAQVKINSFWKFLKLDSSFKAL
jgi:hypothetical protein